MSFFGGWFSSTSATASATKRPSLLSLYFWWAPILLFVGILIPLRSVRQNSCYLASPSQNTISKSKTITTAGVLRFWDVPQPAQCGVFYFYHVGKCGGTSVSTWMRQLSEANPEKIELINWWWQKQQHNGYDWRVDLQKIEDTIRSGRLSQDQNNWLLVHHHHGAPGLRYMIPKYQTWRETLQGQGCDLILTTVVREPFSRAKSLIHYNHIPEKNFYDFVSRYISQAEYLLFNRAIRLTQFLEPNYLGGPRDPKHLTTTNVVLDNTELTELTGYLQDNFQLVGQTHELDDFIAKSEFLTGFYKLSKRQGKALTKNPSDPRYNFTADMKAFLEPHLTADKILMERLFGN